MEPKSGSQFAGQVAIGRQGLGSGLNGYRRRSICAMVNRPPCDIRDSGLCLAPKVRPESTDSTRRSGSVVGRDVLAGRQDGGYRFCNQPTKLSGLQRIHTRLPGFRASFAGTMTALFRGMDRGIQIVTTGSGDIAPACSSSTTRPTPALYGEHLRFCGFRVVTANNGEEGVAAAHAEWPAVIVMDLQMPRMDGWEANRHLVRILLRRKSQSSRSAPSRSATPGPGR